ncbi:hypothetical protein [Mesobacillus foraminis]|uniref:hypothetical protein n=1 Tax=Mesobacillus foraminis TaxID=279826 RepID=UPI0013CF3AFF|nr:hypothetical protein [Mesobacillus foraminis]
MKGKPRAGLPFVAFILDCLQSTFPDCPAFIPDFIAFIPDCIVFIPDFIAFIPDYMKYIPNRWIQHTFLPILGKPYPRLIHQNVNSVLSALLLLCPFKLL